MQVLNIVNLTAGRNMFRLLTRTIASCLLTSCVGLSMSARASMHALTRICSTLGFTLFAGLSTASAAGLIAVSGDVSPRHLIASTGNLYWTSYHDIDDVYPRVASVWREGKNGKPGEETELYSETSWSLKPFGSIALAKVGTWYGYFIANDMSSGSPSTYTSSIKRVPLAGGAATTLATLSRFVGQRSLRTDGAYLYWADENGIRRMPIGGGNVTTLATTTSAQVLSLGSNFVYYSDGNNVRRVLKTGGVVGFIATSPEPVTALYTYATAAGSRVLWGDRGGAVYGKTVGATTVTTYQAPSAGRATTSVGFDGLRLLWTDCSGNGCRVLSRSGNVTKLLQSGGVGTGHLQWDATQTFWVDNIRIWKYVY